MAQQQYRKLTTAELTRLGYSRGSERYVRKGATVAKKNTISRRAYDSESGRYDAWGGRAKFERRYDVASYRFFAERIEAAHGKDFRKDQANPNDKDLQFAYRAAIAKRKGGRQSRNPRGVLAKFLVEIGLREPDWTFDVGDTPPS